MCAGVGRGGDLAGGGGGAGGGSRVYGETTGDREECSAEGGGCGIVVAEEYRELRLRCVDGAAKGGDRCPYSE